MVVIEVQQSVVRHTAVADLILYMTSVLTFSYITGRTFVEIVFLPGRLYDGSRSFENSLKPLSSTTEKGWKSQAIIFTRASSSLLCLNGSIGLVTKLPIEVCCCGLRGLAAAWVVLSAAGKVDAVDIVAVAVAGPVEEVLLVEPAPAAAVPSSLSSLTCGKSTVGCAVLRCLLMFEVLPP